MGNGEGLGKSYNNTHFTLHLIWPHSHQTDILR